MSQELEDEVTSINSIYEPDTLRQLHEGGDIHVYALAFPQQPDIHLRLEFPTDYPNAPPSVLGTESVGQDVAKGDGIYVVNLTREILAEVYTPGVPCIFDLIEEVGTRLQEVSFDQGAKNAQQQTSEADGQLHLRSTDEPPSSDVEQQYEPLGEEPPWTLSEVMSERKSVFVARSASVSSVDEAKRYLAHLLLKDKKVSKATHNITAWRIKGASGIQYQDCDDDGETAAGGRLLHLLELMNVWNTMVVVTRWYGGIQLGPDRFRIINQTARDALIKGGFAADSTNKKKGRK